MNEKESKNTYQYLVYQLMANKYDQYLSAIKHRDTTSKRTTHIIDAICGLISCIAALHYYSTPLEIPTNQVIAWILLLIGIIWLRLATMED